MVKQMSEDEVYAEAKRRVKAKKGFYGNFTGWAVVNSILVIIWALSDPGGYPWFLWPLGIWGVFVLFNFLSVFVFERKTDVGAIEKEVKKIKGEQGQS